MMQSLHSTDKPHSNSYKKLSRYSRSELTRLKDKNLQMLNNPSVIDTLPDRGAKLRETNEMIDNLLNTNQCQVSATDDITVNNTVDQECPLTRRLEEMSVLTPGQGARKRSVDLANQQAFNHYTSSGLLARPTSKHQPSSMYSYQAATAQVLDHAKVRMLTLDESLNLQKEQRPSVIKSQKPLDFSRPSRSLLNSLNLSIDLIQEVDLNNIELPQEDEEEEEDNYQVEPMMID